ncbi:MAG TPA: DNA translocase FtsK 4TM domain-containing protein, partial [Pyrinomonadaceae bacterium]|nr:DNA translocase FtsK 4TM domain-containing protein [Pyrinomonadaceae bacterium]
MATTQTEARAGAKAAGPRRSLRNEIIAIALFALGLLITLSLVFFHPDDPSWNAFSPNETRNLVGPVGANLAQALL